MTPTKIVRPDLRKPDSFQVVMDTDMLQWLLAGALEKCKHLRYEISLHDKCDMFKDDGCMVREQWLIDAYGTVNEAVAQGCRLSDCSEDLAYRYGELSRLMDFITQTRFMSTRPSARSMREIDEVEAQFLAIQGEMAHRTAQLSVQTGTLPKLTEEKLRELDESRELDQPLLGLQDPLNIKDDGKPSKAQTAVVQPASKPKVVK